MRRLENLTLLYIENDLVYRSKNSALLRKNGMKVIETDTTVGARNLLNNTVDLILIDLNLHKNDRMDFIRFLREKEVEIPIIITANCSDKEILLEAINLDTSYYLIKPFDDSQLLIALQFAARKLSNNVLLPHIDLLNGYSYDSINKSVNRPDGSTVQLTQKEYLLFDLFLKNKRKCITYEVIRNYIGNGNDMSIDALRTLIRAIRIKTYPELISNHSGLGYRVDI